MLCTQENELVGQSFRTLAFAAALTVVFAASFSQAIVNGETPEKMKLPPQGSAALTLLSAPDKCESVCSGVFISDRLVLTAKHCLYYEEIDPKTKKPVLQDGKPVVSSGDILLSKIDGKLVDYQVGEAVVVSKDLDLAMVRFAPKTANQYSELAYEEAHADQHVAFRDYGPTTFVDSDGYLPLQPDTYQESAARVQITSIDHDELVFRLHSTGPHAVSGDSGGMISDENGHLIGLLITEQILDDKDEYQNQWYENRGIDLNSKVASSFIIRAAQFLISNAKNSSVIAKQTASADLSSKTAKTANVAEPEAPLPPLAEPSVATPH
jgi:hypothetical protein